MIDEERDKKEKIVAVFSRSASTYDRVGPRYFAHFGKRLVEVARIAPGASVLDVAAGRGAVLFPAQQQVGSRGRVIGIDLSAEMVRETAAELQDAGWPNAEMLQMDAEELRFADASFDWVLCGFSIWFFPDPQRALAEFFRVLKPGGSIGITTWAQDCPTHTSCSRVVRQYLPPQHDQGQEPSRFDTPPILETALQQAGFEGIAIFAEDGEFIYADEDEWWSSLWAAGRRRYLEQMTASVQRDVKANLLQTVQVFQQGRIRAVRRALFAVGNKALREKRP